MNHLRIDRDSFALLKTCLRTIHRDIGSSHADEVLAAGFGFRTYASLVTALPANGQTIDVVFEEDRANDRLGDLGLELKLQMADVAELFAAKRLIRSRQNIGAMAKRAANDNAGNG